jgi:ubiquitin carboxyl-terminal hydrolase 8
MGGLCCKSPEAILLPRTFSAPEEVKSRFAEVQNSSHLSFSVFHPLNPSRSEGFPGLENLGNTCFMNAALQCIVNTQPLLDYFLIGLFESDMNLNKNPYGSAGSFSNALACLAVASWKQEGSSLVPKHLLDLVNKFAPCFQQGVQHDAHEFLSFLLDVLHEELNRADKTSNCPSIGHSKSCENRAARSWRRHLKNNSSIIVDLFQGQLRSTTKCANCKGESVRFENFIQLSIPIAKGKKSSLVECLKDFSRAQIIPKESGWVCPRCQVKVQAFRKSEIWKLPPILILHLKRVHFDGKKFSKINEMVSYPLEGLDLSELAVGIQKDLPDYNLYGQINHKGSLEKGHFYSIVKNWRNNCWYSCDDSEVRPKNPKKIVGKYAYMLFYQKAQVTTYSRQQLENPELWPHEISLSRIHSTISDEESVSFISNCSHFSGSF